MVSDESAPGTKIVILFGKKVIDGDINFFFFIDAADLFHDIIYKNFCLFCRDPFESSIKQSDHAVI